MDSRFRVRPIRSADVDAAMGLVRLAGDYERRPATAEATRRTMQLMAAGELTDSGAVLVAEETSSGRVVGVVTAGPPGLWARGVVSQLPAEGARQWAQRVGEIYEVAVHPDFRRHGIATELMNQVSETPAAMRWWLVLWFFHSDDEETVRFHEGMAPTLETGTFLNFVDPGGKQVLSFRELKDGLRVCLGPLHPNVKLSIDPRGTRAVLGLFTGQPWVWSDGVLRTAAAGIGRPSKAEKKREKKARGRARR